MGDKLQSRIKDNSLNSEDIVSELYQIRNILGDMATSLAVIATFLQGASPMNMTHLNPPVSKFQEEKAGNEIKNEPAPPIMDEIPSFDFGIIDNLGG